METIPTLEELRTRRWNYRNAECTLPDGTQKWQYQNLWKHKLEELADALNYGERLMESCKDEHASMLLKLACEGVANAYSLTAAAWVSEGLDSLPDLIPVDRFGWEDTQVPEF